MSILASRCMPWTVMSVLHGERGTSPAATVWVAGHCHACGQDCPGKCVAAVPGATRPPSAPARDVLRPGALARHGCGPAPTPIARSSTAPRRSPPTTAKRALRGWWRSPAPASGTSASPGVPKPAPCSSATSRCSKCARRVATWPGSLAMPRPHLSGGKRSGLRDGGSTRWQDAVAGHSALVPWGHGRLRGRRAARWT